MQNSFVDYVNKQNGHYPLGQLLWVVDRNQKIKIIDNKNNEIFTGKLEDFLIRKNEKYLKMSADKYNDDDFLFAFRLD